MKIERIVFMGTPDFAVPTLKKITVNGYKPILCITQPDKKKGRNKKLLPPPIKIAAQELGIPVIQPENVNTPKVVEKILELNPQLIITVAYGGFIGKKLRNTPDFGAINLHPSLLPKYRGASPINYALFNGDETTGNTVFKLIAKMDAGPIIYQKRIPIEKFDNYTTLSKKLAEQGADDILNVLMLLENGNYNLKPQDDKLATYTKKIEKSDLILNFNENANKIVNKIRGLALKPAGYIIFKNKKLNILDAEKTFEKSDKPPYTITDIIKNVGLKVATKDYDIIIKSVQPAGKKIMNAFAFNLGARLKKGDLLK